MLSDFSQMDDVWPQVFLVFENFNQFCQFSPGKCQKDTQRLVSFGTLQTETDKI